MTYRYEPRLQAFGLEPKACSRYGWEFFLCFVWGFLFFSRASEKKFELRFPGISISGKKSDLKEIFEFLFRSGISRSEIEFFPTEDHEGVRIGSGGNPNKDERRRSQGSFLIHQINRSSFVARKQRIFDGIQTHRDMDGGKNRQAKTEPKERNF